MTNHKGNGDGGQYQKLHAEIGRLHEAVDKVKAAQVKAESRDSEYKKAQTRAANWTAVFTGVLALVAIFGGGISIWQGSLTSKTLKETRNQFQASQRPWIALRGGLVVAEFVVAKNTVMANDPRVAKSTVRASFGYAFENSGNSPARKIAIPNLVPAVTEIGTPPEDWRKRDCSVGEQETKESAYTQLLMPKAFTTTLQGHRVYGGSPIEFEKIKMAWIIGCIVYQDTFGGPVHHTRFVLMSTYRPGQTEVPDFRLYDSDAD